MSFVAAVSCYRSFAAILNALTKGYYFVASPLSCVEAGGFGAAAAAAGAGLAAAGLAAAAAAAGT